MRVELPGEEPKSFTGALIGQADPLTESEKQHLYANRLSETVRIYRKAISHAYGKYAAGLALKHEDKSALIQIGQLKGLAEAWGIPFTYQKLEEEKEKPKP